MPARAQEKPETLPEAKPSLKLNKNDAEILMRWIDARGNLYPGGRIEKMQWVWSRIRPEDPLESPALRLWISSQLPTTWTPKKITGDNVTIAEAIRNNGDRQTIAVDLRGGRGTLRVDFADPQGRISEMSLVLQVTVSRPYILIKPECGKLDLRFLVNEMHTKHLFVGLNCVDSENRFDIYFFRSNDSMWTRKDGQINFDPENRFTAFKHSVDKPKDAVVYSQRLFKVGTQDDAGGTAEYAVIYNPKIKPKRLYYSAGIGFTHYKYKEEISKLDMTQNGFTGKVNVGYRLIPRVLDIAFNGFSTIFALSHSPSVFPDTTVNLPSARFYGLNGRLGYRLPVGLGATEFMFLTGWYFWGMYVPQADVDPEINTYGIKSLSGPQLFLTMINSPAGKRGYWAYFKFAFISDKFRLTTAGRELAVGGGVELSKMDSKPLAATIDIAKAQFHTEPDAKTQNGMELLSITVGIQKSF